MAIGIRANGTWAAAANNASSTQFTIPGTPQSGDLMLLVAFIKPFDASLTIDQGWTVLINETAGSTANGNGLGSTRLFVAYKQHPGTAQTNPTVTWGSSASPAGGAITVLSKASNEVWDIQKLANAVESAMGSTALTLNFTTTAAIQNGDWVFALIAAGDDSATFTRSTTAISGASVTWDGNHVEEPAAHLSTTNGNDGAGDLGYRAVTTGAASGTTITATATLSAAERVNGILFRIGVDTVTTVTGSFTANAFIRKVQAGSFTANAYVKRTWVFEGAGGTATHLAHTNSQTNVVGGGWVNEENAYSTTGDNFYTEASAGVSATHISGDWGFEDIGPGVIPDGSPINEVRIRFETGATVDGAIYLQGYRNGTAQGSEVSESMPHTQKVYTFPPGSITLSDLRSASTVIKGRLHNGTPSQGDIVEVDFIRLEVDYGERGGITADAHIVNPGTTVSGSFTANAHIRKVQSGSVTADAFVQRLGLTGSLTADSYIKRLGLAGTFTADSYVKKVTAGSVSADAYVRRTGIASSFTANAFVRRAGLSGSITADAFIAQTVLGSFVANSHIRATVPGSFTANAHLRGTVAGSFPADAYLKRLGLAGSLTADAYIASRQTGSFSADAYLKRLGLSGSFTVDSYIKRTYASSVTADSYVRRAGMAGSLVADAFVRRVQSSFITADAFIQRTASASVTADAYIKRVGLAGSLTADSYVKRTGLGASLTADAYLKRVGLAGSLTADAYVRRTFSGSFTADAEIVAGSATTVTGSFTANAHIRATVVGSVTADAFVRRTGLSGSLTADAFIQRAFTGSISADAYLKRTQASAFSADAYVLRASTGSITADAWLRSTMAGSFSMDAHIAATVTGSFTADAYIGSISRPVSAETGVTDTMVAVTGADNTLNATAGVSAWSAISGASSALEAKGGVIDTITATTGVSNG